MTAATTFDIADDVSTLYRDGITALKGAFSREWVEQCREDMMTAFWDAIQRPGGAVGRGPRRWYVETHPEAFRGFIDLVSHPWLVSMCESVLGPRYEIVEIGFDVPFQGAKYQPWHRDFPSPPESFRDRKITSLAFNLTGVDVTPDMGPLEVAHGTQWEEGAAWKNRMFPPEDLWPRYAERAVRKFPQAGDLSCRSALTIHPHGDPRLPRIDAASGARPPGVPRGRLVEPHRAKARYRGPGAGGSALLIRQVDEPTGTER
jgi:hypothetical protein